MKRRLKIQQWIRLLLLPDWTPTWEGPCLTWKSKSQKQVGRGTWLTPTRSWLPFCEYCIVHKWGSLQIGWYCLVLHRFPIPHPTCMTLYVIARYYSCDPGWPTQHLCCTEWKLKTLRCKYNYLVAHYDYNSFLQCWILPANRGDCDTSPFRWNCLIL